jgi:type IV pilus assembly protein PilC
VNEYRYTAYTQDKKIISGKLKATSETAAGQAVLKLGYRILTLQPINRTVWSTKLTFGLKLRVIKDKEIAHFFSDLSNMLSSGIILVTALQLIQQQTPNKMLKNVIAETIDMIHTGNSFSGAILKHEEVFSETYYQVIKASERSGNLEQGLKYLASHINKQIETKKRFKQIFNYPIIVLSLAFLIGGFLVTNVLPTLINIFGQMNVELPLITQIVVGVSTFLVENTFSLFMALLITVIFLFLYLRTKDGQQKATRFMLRIPIIKDLLLRTNLLAYTHMSSMLIKAGLQLPNVTYYCAQTIKNAYLREALIQGRNHLIQGRPLSVALRSTGLFDAVSLEKVAIGERTGDIESAFLNISESFEKAIDDSVKAFITIIEPSIIVGIALVVGLLALSIITPMYSLIGSYG